MKNYLCFGICILIASLYLIGCKPKEDNKTQRPLEHASWTKNANIYEINIRQFSQEGTLAAVEKQLPRLQKMGVNIIWLMPIQPIGVKNRKGGLGSNYSVSDYYAVNPNFGTLDDLKHLVKKVHELKMHIIIDWVANHTSWDNVWVVQHPEWYKKNAKCEIYAFEYNNGKEIEHWTDVVGLDYKQPKLWDGMIDALKYWVKETDIDGYRCDVASLVPTKFWERARMALDSIKPVFMLAESFDPELHKKAFDMTYDWDLYEVMSQIAHGKANALDLKKYLEDQQKKYPTDAYRMLFTTNHDKNAWTANDAEQFGNKFKAFAVLAAYLPGMPLIYNGQESVLDKRLSFFEKDTINWKDYALSNFYQEILKMKTQNPSLWNGNFGGKTEILPMSSPFVFAFSRSKNGMQVVVIVNLSDKPQEVKDEISKQMIKLEPWGYQVFNHKV